MTPRTDGQVGGRFIPKDATPFERFQVGDTVAHFAIGDGVITENDGAIIGALYERKYPEHIVAVGGKQIKQNYDAVWFEKNPRLLFHRSA